MCPMYFVFMSSIKQKNYVAVLLIFDKGVEQDKSKYGMCIVQVRQYMAGNTSK